MPVTLRNRLSNRCRAYGSLCASVNSRHWIDEANRTDYSVHQVVNQLANRLKAAGITIWRDKSDLSVGEGRKNGIRGAAKAWR